MSKYNLYVRENIVEAGMDPDIYDPAQKQSQVLVENEVVDDLVTVSSVRPISSNQVIQIAGRVETLEEVYNEYEIYENIESGTSGSVTIPEGAALRLGQYVDGQDCLVAQTDGSGRPIDNIARASDGTGITATLDQAGNYTLSQEPEGYPVSLIFQVQIQGKDVGNINLDFVLNWTAFSNSDSVENKSIVEGTTISDVIEVLDDQNVYAGSIEEPSYTTTATQGEVIVQQKQVLLYDNPDFIGKSRTYLIPEKSISLVNGSMNYIVASYNNGTPEFQNTTNRDSITQSDIVPILSIYAQGATLHTQEWGSLGRGLANKLHESISKTQPYRREFGAEITTYSTRNVRCSAGVIWNGAQDVDLLQIDSSTTPMLYFKKDAGAWVLESATQYNNTQYSDGTNTVELTSNRYAVNWIYRGVEQNKHLYLVLGTGDYTASEAVESKAPSDLPTAITSHAVLVGRVIVQKDSNTAYQIDSAWSDGLQVSPVSNHDDLAGVSLIGSGVTYGHMSYQDQDVYGKKTFQNGVGGTIIIDETNLGTVATKSDLESTVTLTVGSTATYATIGAALQAAVKNYYPNYPYVNCIVQIQTGFDMKEQVIVESLDLSWIRITSVPDTVTLIRSDLTTNVGSPYGINVFPAFAGINGAKLPVIDTVFSMTTGGTADDRDGLVCINNSSATITQGSGFTNAGRYGVSAYFRSDINAEGANLGSPGVMSAFVGGGSFINARNITGTVTKEVTFIGGAGVTDIGDYNNLTEKGVIFH